VPKGVADISNTAVRMFLHAIGRSYDSERGFAHYTKRHFPQVKEFFKGTCCYCGISESEQRLTGDHLVPTNRTALGLEAWGNIVPACGICNEKKHDNDWELYMSNFTDAEVDSRTKRIRRFVAHYKYAPNLEVIRLAVVELYEESGGVVQALVDLKVKRALERMSQTRSS